MGIDDMRKKEYSELAHFFSVVVQDQIKMLQNTLVSSIKQDIRDKTLESEKRQEHNNEKKFKQLFDVQEVLQEQMRKLDTGLADIEDLKEQMALTVAKSRFDSLVKQLEMFAKVSELRVLNNEVMRKADTSALNELRNQFLDSQSVVEKCSEQGQSTDVMLRKAQKSLDDMQK